MKKFTLLFAALIGLAGQANAQYGEELELGSISGWGWSKKTIVTSSQEIPQLPASVSIPGNWGDVKLYTGSFDANDYRGIKVVLAEKPADGSVQFLYRNAAQASSYSGSYVHWEGDDGAITSEDGTTSSITFNLDNLGDDAVITQVALQNRTSSAVTVVVNAVFMIDKDGNEVPSTGLQAAGWNAATITPLTVPEDGESKDVYEFTSQYGEIGVDFGETQVVEADKPHIFTLVSSEPIPTSEFQWKLYNEGGGNSYVQWTIGPENVVTLEMTANYTGLSIQHFVSSASTLPQDIKLYRKIVGGPLSTERLPIVVGTSYSSAEIIDPNPSMEQGENGLPIRVSFSSQWQDVKLWQETFNAAEYPACRIVLDARPADGALQFFYRTEADGSSGGIYVPTEGKEGLTITDTEDGVVYEFEFDLDEMGEDLEVVRLALQSRVGDAVSTIIKNVYLMNEDEEWIETAGLTADGWNPAKMLAVGGSYDDAGNIYDAFVKFNATNDYVGTYSGTVEEGTYHKVIFTTDEPLGDDFSVVCQNIGLDWNTFQWTFEDVDFDTEGSEGNKLVVNIPASYNSLYVRYTGEDVPKTVRFTKITREVYEGEYVTVGIKDIADDAAATVKSVQYFDAAGVQVAQPTKGIVIVRETLSNGNVRAKKVMFK